MRNFIILAVLALALGHAACKQEAKGVTTKSGYRFINHTNKNGAKPQPGGAVLAHAYFFIGDSLFQSTRKGSSEPIEFPVPKPEDIPEGSEVPPIFEALMLMTEGDSATIYQPLDSMMRASLPPFAKDVKEFKFQLALYKVITADEIAKKQEEARKEAEAVMARLPEVQSAAETTVKDYKAGKLTLNTTASGLKILVKEQGSGAALKTGETIKVHYFGCLTDGKSFDNSFQRGEPMAFPVGVGRMIPGFDEGAATLNHGGKAYLFIPSQLGYGDAGSPPAIPGKAELVFYIEVQ